MHDISVNIINKNATQREQAIVGRLSIITIGVLTIIFALNPQAPIAALVSFAFAFAAIVLFSMFFLGLINGGAGFGIDMLLTWMPAIGSGLISVPVVFIVTIVVSLLTAEPPKRTKMMVRQCHSPEPMDRDVTAAEIVAEKTDGNVTPDGD